MTEKQWTEESVPTQSGRVAVVTGANTGIGFHTARVLAGRGATVVLAVRSIERGKDAAARISESDPGADLRVQHLDVGSLASIRATAEQLRAAHDRIDLLINNAGVCYPPYSTTADGFELQFGVNHLGPFALTGLLLDRLAASPAARVIAISSMDHRFGAKIHFDDLQGERRYRRFGAYGQSKLANLLFTYELQRRLATHEQSSSVSALAAHPGGALTELGRDMPGPLRWAEKRFGRLIMQEADMGALPTLRAATDPDATGGQYYGPSGRFELMGYPVLVPSNKRSHDVEVARRLWRVSEELTGVTYAF